MAEKGNQDPSTGTEKDISKAQSQQQPPSQATQQPPESGQQGEQDLTDQAKVGQQGETLAKQRTDVEGASLKSPEKGEAESGFVGAEGEQDTSSELVEDEDKKGFAPEGK